jgi:CheY-like chemotaxis protein
MHMSDDRAPIQRRRILIVEDEAPIRALYGDFLGSRFDLIVVPCYDTGKAAIALGDFDLLLTDRHLPGGDGHTLAEQARALGLPALMVSGSTRPDDAYPLKIGDRVPQDQPYLFLPKPFRLSYLNQVINEVLA